MFVIHRKMSRNYVFIGKKIFTELNIAPASTMTTRRAAAAVQFLLPARMIQGQIKGIISADMQCFLLCETVKYNLIDHMFYATWQLLGILLLPWYLTDVKHQKSFPAASVTPQ